MKRIPIFVASNEYLHNLQDDLPFFEEHPERFLSSIKLRLFMRKLPSLGRLVVFFIFLYGSSIPVETFGQTTASVPECTNDNICDAINLGLSVRAGRLGDGSLGLYKNTCATGRDEPNPWDARIFWNDAGVWYTFQTDDNPGPMVVIDAFSDPENAGNPMDMEIALYTSSNGLCDGQMTVLKGAFGINALDARLVVDCPTPNTTYFVLVDGVGSFDGGPWGNFGIEVYQPVVEEAADGICDAAFLGVVPEGGSLDSGGAWSNFCATAAGDPRTEAFSTQVGVWFQFTAPSSGHVIVDGIADQSIFPLGIQLAVLGTDDQTCTGSLIEFGSNFSDAELDETLEVSCLRPGGNYWILIDGFGAGGRGVFSLEIRDAGDITPRTFLTETICAGDSFPVADRFLVSTGSYIDTINLYEGCDSIVFTDLTVLAPIAIQVEQVEPAMGLGAENGRARVVVTGGTGNYQIDWCNGETGTEANGLLGNAECCVQVIDDLGCTGSTCFTMDLVTLLTSVTEGDTLACAGDEDASISFSIDEGIAPYDYSWSGGTAGLQGTGTIQNSGEMTMLDELPGGTYTIEVTDGFGVSTFDIEVIEPPALELAVLSLEPVSCFGDCDGQAELMVSGGTGAIALRWGDGEEGMARQNLCGGMLDVEAIDTRGCREALSVSIDEPAAFIATPVLENDVSCYEGSDGRGRVTTNGNPRQIAWSNGATTAEVDQLPGGTYQVTVTNEDGCTAETELVVQEPEVPLEAGITVEKPVSCFNDGDGMLLASVVGPGTAFTYQWSNGRSEALAEGLFSGEYGVTVTNEHGCEATDALFLAQPEALQADLQVRSITCLDELDSGAISIVDISGGNPGYEYSVNGGPFQSSPNFSSLTEGEYDLIVRDAKNCRISFQGFVNGPPEVDVELGGDLTLFLGDSLDLVPSYKGENLVFSWFEGSRQVGGDQTALPVKPLFSGIYTVEVFDSVQLCRARDEIRITVDKTRRFFAPNAFSPNGDSNNDQFMVYGGQDVELVETMRIFDRYGNLMYEAFDFYPGDESSGWDGSFQGQVLSTGVYIYFAEVRFIDQRTEVFKGEVSLLK